MTITTKFQMLQLSFFLFIAIVLLTPSQALACFSNSNCSGRCIGGETPACAKGRFGVRGTCICVKENFQSNRSSSGPRRIEPHNFKLDRTLASGIAHDVEAYERGLGIAGRRSKLQSLIQGYNSGKRTKLENDLKRAQILNQQSQINARNAETQKLRLETERLRQEAVSYTHLTLPTILLV